MNNCQYAENIFHVRSITERSKPASKQTREIAVLNDVHQAAGGERRHEPSEFMSMRHMRQVIEAWRQEYNGERPHSSLGYLRPNRFAESFLNADSISD